MIRSIPFNFLLSALIVLLFYNHGSTQKTLQEELEGKTNFFDVMWSLHSIKHDNLNALIEYVINKPGKVEIIAARQIQEKLDVLYSGTVLQGKHNIDVDISRLPSEFHYVLLFYEGKLIHFQELDLRHTGNKFEPIEIDNGN